MCAVSLCHVKYIGLEGIRVSHPKEGYLLL